MPELAEVEHYRRRWDAGLGDPVLAVRLHPGKRVFRGADVAALRRGLTGVILLGSEVHGKQMLFRFSSDGWLGLHLGMTGRLLVESAGFRPGPHDHLVLHQAARALVFHDPRQFGRVRFHCGSGPPAWWRELPPLPTASAFTPALLAEFLRRHGRAPLKAVLLRQEGFPGIGNWMADEILWRTALHPGRRTGRLRPATVRRLWRVIRWVCRAALRHISPAHGDPPRDWLFHQRWLAGGRCPRDGQPLVRATWGGRTTAWCPRCQRRDGRA